MAEPRNLLLIGTGHAHLETLLHLSELTGRGHRVTVVSPLSYYYSGMIPGVLSGRYSPETAQIAIGPLVQSQGAEWIPERAVRIDPVLREAVTESGRSIPYDILSLDVGSVIDRSGIPIGRAELDGGCVLPVRPLENIVRARREIIDRLAGGPIHVAVIGGGPAGVEIAGNLLHLDRHRNGGQPSVTLFSGDRILSGFPSRVRRWAIESLSRRGAALRIGSRVSRIGEGKIHLSDGSAVPFDFVLIASGVRPSSLPRESGLPVDAEGGMRVDRFLRAQDIPSIFGGGDCISFTPGPLRKTGVYALKQGPVLRRNLAAALEGRDKQFEAFRPQRSIFLALNMGDGSAIGCKGPFASRGRMVLRLKEFFDFRFIHSVAQKARAILNRKREPKSEIR